MNTDWQKPTLWAILVIAALMAIASFTSNGHGMFGSGFMSGTMWVWMIIPVLFLVLLVILILDRRG